jgi:hypothetical protein
MSALRLVFGCRGGAIELRSRERVDIICPRSDPFVGDGGESGFWYEVRDSDERPLYRRVAKHPLEGAMEVPFDESGERSFSWQPQEDVERLFVALAPELNDGKTLVLSGSPPEEPGSPAGELARFPVADQER